MEIIYRQTSADKIAKALGIQNCYVKRLSAKNDSKTTSRKMHHHTGFEIHFINKGHQKYIIDKKEYLLSNGQILIIPPACRHYVADAQFYESKFSITFNCYDVSPFKNIDRVCFLNENKRIIGNLNQALQEFKISSFFSKQIIENIVYECLVILLRLNGHKEKQEKSENSLVDDRVFFAKRYIEDNIEFNIAVTDVAAYCSLGTKQLTRLFKTYENTTPLRYIQEQKIRHIETLLLKGEKLKDISEKMNFSSEYHFNSFYKKYAGVSPGVYKKMHTQ